MLTGEQQFALFWRTLPWDHAPGTLLVREAGGVARRFDGADYDPADEGRGLLVAANEQIWDEVRDALLGALNAALGNPSRDGGTTLRRHRGRRVCHGAGHRRSFRYRDRRSPPAGRRPAPAGTPPRSVRTGGRRSTEGRFRAQDQAQPAARSPRTDPRCSPPSRWCSRGAAARRTRSPARAAARSCRTRWSCRQGPHRGQGQAGQLQASADGADRRAEGRRGSAGRAHRPGRRGGRAVVPAGSAHPDGDAAQHRHAAGVPATRGRPRPDGAAGQQAAARASPRRKATGAAVQDRHRRRGPGAAEAARRDGEEEEGGRGALAEVSSGSSDGFSGGSSTSAKPAPRNSDGSWPSESCSVNDPTDLRLHHPAHPATLSSRPRRPATSGTSPASAAAAAASTRRGGPATSRPPRAASRTRTRPAATRRTATAWPPGTCATPTGWACST